MIRIRIPDTDIYYSDQEPATVIEEKPPSYVWYSLAYNFAAAATTIGLYYQYDGDWLDGNGLYLSSIVGIGLTVAKMMCMKGFGKPIGAMDWLMLISFTLIGLPALLLNNELLRKLQSPIISAIAFLAFTGVNACGKKPIFERCASDHIFRMALLPYMEPKDINNVPRDAWRKVDYCNAVDFFVSAVAGTAVALWCSEDAYVPAKYAISSLGILNFIAQYFVLKPYKETEHTFRRSNP
jgi:intracellular septation protein A